MQKVVGSSPIIRSLNPLETAGFLIKMKNRNYRWRGCLERRLKMAVAGAAVCLLAAACGGGSSKTYSRAAFASCLRHNSFRTIPHRAIPGKGFKTILSIAPTLIVGYFPDKEYSVFIFTADAKAAQQVKTKIDHVRKEDKATTAASIQQLENLVIVTPENPGVANTIVSCEKTSLVN